MLKISSIFVAFLESMNFNFPFFQPAGELPVSFAADPPSLTFEPDLLYAQKEKLICISLFLKRIEPLARNT